MSLMICPKAKECTSKCPFKEPHKIDSWCKCKRGKCPACIPYIPEQPKKPVEPTCPECVAPIDGGCLMECTGAEGCTLDCFHRITPHPEGIGFCSRPCRGHVCKPWHPTNPTPSDTQNEMPLIQPFPHFPLVSSIEDCDCCICTLIKQQRDADMAWLPAHDSAVAAKAVKEFAEKVLATMPEYSDSDYTAGLINDYGGGNVGWWQDYIRCEVERCNEYWKDRVKDAVEMALAHIRAMAEE